MVTRDVEGTLHNVVCEFVVNHLGEAILGVSDLDTDYSVQNHAFTAFRGELKAFLNDVRAELMQAVRHNIVNNLIDYKALLFKCAALNHMRYDIVPEFMHCQLGYHAHDLFSDKLNLIPREPLHNTLYDATSILIFAKLDHLDLYKLNNELSHVKWNFSDDSLDHMVALRVVHALNDHLLVQLAYKHALTMFWENFKCFLDDTAAVFIEGKLRNLHHKAVEQLIDPLLVAEIKDHLDYEVSEDISHQTLLRLRNLSSPVARECCRIDYVLFVFADFRKECVLIFR